MCCVLDAAGFTPVCPGGAGCGWGIGARPMCVRSGVLAGIGVRSSASGGFGSVLFLCLCDGGGLVRPAHISVAVFRVG